MNEIIYIIGFACMGNLIVDFIANFKPLNRLSKIKPFNCEMCFTFWLSITFMLISFGLTGILLAAISAVVSNFIYKYI
tara:strand:+ start:7423 stop:7656 length:234 start_codon:yes stop_codon:yes gene_type:complete